MPDLGAKYTDEQIARMEKQLKSVYNQAYKDILQKQKDFNEKYAKKEAKYAAQVASGQITQEQFDSWKKGQVFQGEQWQNKKKDILNTIYNSNKIATDIVNGKTQNVFVFNANYMSYELEHGAGVNFGFSLYDSATVVNLIKNDPQLLPKWKIDQPKDYTWNQKKLNRQISLGIIEGESLDKIATRFSDSLATQNFNKMRTFARTAMTGAQNSGRQISLNNAKSLGIKLKKEWMATLDNHTRINHMLLDGQKVNTDDDFEVDGLKIRYPGDPQAVPAMTYNCRCTMVGDIEDYPSEYDRYDNVDGKPIKNMTYTEWEAAKSKGEDISPVPLTYTEWEAAKKKSKPSANTIINGKDIPSTPEFSISDTVRKSVTPKSASDDWFEYEYANAMREYIGTGDMPTEDINGEKIDIETRKRLAAEAELMQNIGSTTKTGYKTLYRGMVLDEDDVRSMFTPGEYYTFDTLSATTTDRGIAKIYMDPENMGGEGVPVILEIQKSDGIFGFDRDGIEVVLPKGSEFKITRNWMDGNGVVHISLYSKKGKNVGG